MEGTSGYFIQEYLFISIGDYYNATIDLALYCLITRLIAVFLYNNNILFWFFFSKKVFAPDPSVSWGFGHNLVMHTANPLPATVCPQNQLREYLRFAVWLHTSEF